MLKIDDNLLQSIGLGTLPVNDKRGLLTHIYETLEMRVGMRLADQMTNEQLDEFETYFEAKDDAGAFKWLETNFPNYKDIVNEEFDKLKGEVQTAAPQILAAAQVNAQNPQATPAAPMPDASQAAPQPQPMTDPGAVPQPQMPPAPAGGAQPWPPTEPQAPAPAADPMAMPQAPTPQPFQPATPTPGAMPPMEPVAPQPMPPQPAQPWQPDTPAQPVAPPPFQPAPGTDQPGMQPPTSPQPMQPMPQQWNPDQPTNPAQ